MWTVVFTGWLRGRSNVEAGSNGIVYWCSFGFQEIYSFFPQEHHFLSLQRFSSVFTKCIFTKLVSVCVQSFGESKVYLGVKAV